MLSTAFSFLANLFLYFVYKSSLEFIDLSATLLKSIPDVLKEEIG